MVKLLSVRKLLLVSREYFDGRTLYFLAILLAATGHLYCKVLADNSKRMDLAVKGTATKTKPHLRAA